MQNGPSSNAAPSLSQSNNTLTLTVSVNQDNHQERLFRLSPLSSKMQEDTEGEEGSSHRNFLMDQSINDSQVDSASPAQSRQRNSQQDFRMEREQLAQTSESLPRGPGLDAEELKDSRSSNRYHRPDTSPANQRSLPRSQANQASASQTQSNQRAETPADQNGYSTRAFSRSSQHRTVL